jgi:UDP-2,3-diacylglucosamine hydrolase
VSDLHLSTSDEGKVREKIFITWLNDIKYNADKIFLLGDMFNFWFEYEKVVPHGYTRFLGKLAELIDEGIEIHYFVGNHDMWINDYFSNDIGLKVHCDMAEIEIGPCRFFLGHGHELTKNIPDKLLFKIYNNALFRNMLGAIHPRWGISLGNYLSEKNNKKNVSDIMRSDGNNYQMDFARQQLKNKHYDYFIFGHTHLPSIQKLSSDSSYINTGDWINFLSYAVFDGNDVQLKYYSKE